MSQQHPAFLLLGAVAPGIAAVAKPDPKNPHIGLSLVPGVALGVGGFVVGGKYGHPFLGFMAAEAVGLNAYRAYRNHPGDRTIAATNLATTGTMIAGSLAWKAHPFWGGLLGLLAGVVATSFVKGSNSARLQEWFR